MHVVEQIAEPTPEQRRHGQFDLEDITDKRNGGGSITIGKAYRRQPMIDVLAAAEVFSDAEHKALSRYRYFADLADRSPLRDSLDRTIRHSHGNGPTVAFLTAVQIRDVCERAAGSLRDILRAVVIYDQSLSQWAIERGGGFDKSYTRVDRSGRTIKVNELRAKPAALRRARLEIQMAAKRVQAEMDA